MNQYTINHILNEPTACTKCGKVFPWSPKYFQKRKIALLGCTQPCKHCNSRRAVEWTKNHRERDRIKCKKWRENHKDKKAITDRAYYETHREQCILAMKAHYKAHKGQYATAHREWVKSHKEEIAEIRKRWAKANPLSARLVKQRRRIREKDAFGILTQYDINIQYKNQKGHCWWCGKDTKSKFHIDHRIPLAKGGLHDRANIVISCPKCNSSKGTKLPQDFAGRLL